MYKVQVSRQAKKDAVHIERSGLKAYVYEIIETIEKDPFEPSQGFEELRGKWKGSYSRRINKKHRFVYTVLPNTDKEADEQGNIYKGVVKVLTMWTHYERL
ncbi:MAG: Txe/YoeB family addiction module toxin [Defluviitaleaceae bacterium]|nr:Txe/YoeB family addiction module toxin [Defluviitaleaceae bacterium]